MRKIIFILFLVLTTGVYGQDSYKVYKLQGTAYKGKGTTEQVKNGDIIRSSDYLNLTKCQRIALLDNETKKVYYIEDRNTDKVSQMILRVKRQSRSTSKRIFNTAMSRLSDSQRSRYSEIGAAMRGNNTDYDNTTWYVYMKMCQYMTNASIEYPREITYLWQQESGDSYLSISNNSDTDLFVCVLYKPSGSDNILDLFGEDLAYPSLLVPANSTTDLPHIILAESENTFMLVACDECFSGHDLSVMMNKHIAPLNESDFEEIPSKVIFNSRITK